MRKTVVVAFVVVGTWCAAAPDGLAQEGAGDAGTVTDVMIAGEGFTLPATFELPAAEGPVPCAVFFAGSGPTDRNWNSAMVPGGGNGSAQQLAEALRARGVGSLRYDKIATGSNETPLEMLSMQHYADEGIAAYDHLVANAHCGRIFLIANSEGFLHAIRVANARREQPDFGGLVSMSGPSDSLGETMVDQIRPQLATAGYDEAQATAALEVFRAAIAGLPETATTPPDFSVLPDLGQFWQMLAGSGPPQLLADLLTFEPLTAAAAYNGPILVMSAANDVQIPVEDGDAIFAAVPDAGQVRQRVTIPEANHVYKHETRSLTDTDPTSLMMAYWEEGRPLAPGTVEAILTFMHAVLSE